MRHMMTCVLVSLLIISFAFASDQKGEFPVLRGSYLGQRPPGSYPEIFGPGVISVDADFEHSAAVFSPDGKEVFWCTNVGWYDGKGKVGMLRLYYMKEVDGQWTAPQPAPFVKDIRVERPVFSPDGNSLYFERDNPNSEDDMDIYVVHRLVGGWSKPEPVSPLINSRAVERLYCVTTDGSMYFSRNLMRPDEEVFVSRYVNGAFTEPVKLGNAYNSNGPELAIVLGPREEYMLTAVLNAQHSASELCVSYRKADGTWSERVKTPYECGGFLALSPDGKYLFFLNEAICWVSTSFVEALRLKQ